MVNKVQRVQQVRLDLLVWLDLKVSQGLKDQKVKKEKVENLVLEDNKGVPVKMEMMEQQAQK